MFGLAFNLIKEKFPSIPSHQFNKSNTHFDTEETSSAQNIFLKSFHVVGAKFFFPSLLEQAFLWPKATKLSVMAFLTHKECPRQEMSYTKIP